MASPKSTEKTNRNIRQPSEFNDSELSGYFMIANKDAAIAITSKLTGSQLRLWLYLMIIDSFGDSTADGERIYHPIPSPQELAIRIGASVETVEKDMRKLKKFGLYDYRVTRWQGHNSSAAKAKTESSQMKEKKAQKQAEKGRGLNSPQSGLNNLNEGLNNPAKSLNKPQPGLNKLSEEPETFAEYGFEVVSQTIQTIQTISDKQTAPENPQVEETNLAPENQELVCEKDLERESISPLSESKTEIKLSPQATHLGLDRSSEISLAGEYQNGCQKFEGQFKQRVELMPFEEWVDGRIGGRKQFKSGFVELWRQYLNTTPRYVRDLRREANIGEAKASILNTSRSPEGKEMLMARWESFEELRQQKERREAPNHQQYEVVDEVREAILKKRQALAERTA